MSQKFLSSVTLAGLASGSILKVNSDGLIVEAVAGTDYVTSVSSGNLNALTDVAISNPSADQILVYGQPLGGDPGVNIWYNKTPNYLTSYTETDPIYTASSWYTTTNNASNWDTAYGWGNHSGLYANLIHTHSVFTQATSGIANGEEVIVAGENGFVPASGFDDGGKFLRGDGTWQIVTTDLTGYATETWVGQQGYLTSYTETDPVYTASSWYTTTNNSTNWNTAYGWGNHAGLYASATHNHDDRYYTETETDTLLSGKADTDHTHDIADVTGLQTALDKKLEDESDTLDTVTGRGATTTNNISVGELSATGGIIYLGTANTSSGHINSYENMTFNIDSDNDDTNRYFAWYTNGNSASGSELMRLTESGNVGIGTTAPAANLHVYGSGTTYATIQAGGGAYAYVRLQTPSSGSGYLIKNTGTGNALLSKSLYLWNDVGPIQFVTNQTAGNAVTIDTSGNLGIGTASPAKKLDVRGGYFMTNDGTGKESAFVQGGTGYAYFGNLNAGPAAFGNSEDWTTLVVDGGNVGIGTTSPSQKLEVVGDIRIGQNSAIRFNTSGSSNDPGLAMLSDASFEFYNTASSTTLKITNGGNVGIGTTSPAYKLDVIGDIRSSLALRAGGNLIVGGYTDITGQINHRSDVRVLNKAASNWLSWATRDATGAEAVIDLNYIGDIIASGNVGIGTTSPTEKLDVNGRIIADAYLGRGTTSTSDTGTGFASYDILDSITGPGLYQVTIVANPNSAGSSAYADYLYGKIIIGTGWNGTAITNYIHYVQENPDPRSMYPSGGGNMTVEAFFVVNDIESSSVANGTAYSVRIKISGYAVAGAGTVVRTQKLH